MLFESRRISIAKSETPQGRPSSTSGRIATVSSCALILNEPNKSQPRQRACPADQLSHRENNPGLRRSQEVALMIATERLTERRRSLADWPVRSHSSRMGWLTAIRVL
jgi:hypothetical protein